MTDEQKEIEELAKSFYMRFSLMSNPKWEGNDSPFARKCRNEAEAMIKERKSSPEPEVKK